MNIFTDHPTSVGETYFEHLRAALGFGFSMVGAGLACMVHGLVPALFVKTGSNTIENLHQQMVIKRRARSSYESS